MVKNFSCFYL